MVTLLRKLSGAGLAAGMLCIAAADLSAQEPPAPAGDARPAAAAAPANIAVPDSLRSKPHDPNKVGHARVGTFGYGHGACQPGCANCQERKCCLCGSCLLRNLACCDSCIDKHCLDDCLNDHCLEEKLAELHCAADHLHFGLRDLIRKDCEYKKRHLSAEYLHRRYGYFFPQGSGGEGTPFLGHYHMGYAVNPYHFDPRDAYVYAAQGYGAPMAVPLPPNVEHTYNYGWGIPSSRLTGINRYYQEPGIIGPPSAPLARGHFAGSYGGMYSADRFAPARNAKPLASKPKDASKN
jgi:hypothetical protein